MKQQYLLLGLLCILLSCTATKTNKQKEIAKAPIILQIEQFEQLPNKRFCGVAYKVSASITNNSKAPITIILPFQKAMGTCMNSYFPEYFSPVVEAAARPQYIEQSLEISDQYTKTEKHIQTIDPSVSSSFVFYGYHDSTLNGTGTIDTNFKGETSIQLKYKIDQIIVDKYKSLRKYAGLLPAETIESLTLLDIDSNKLSVTVK